MAVQAREIYEIEVENVEYIRHGDKPLLARLFRPGGAAAVDAGVRCVVLCWPVIDPLARYRYAKKLKEGGKPYPDLKQMR